MEGVDGKQPNSAVKDDRPPAANRPAVRPLGKSPDEATAVVFDLSDGQTETLQTRIKDLSEKGLRMRDRLSKVKKEEKVKFEQEITRLETEKIRLEKLLDIHMSFLELAIAWDIAGLKLEVGHLDAQRLMQGGRPQK